MNDTERLPWLDVARGVSILLVVAFHASIRLERAGMGHEAFWWINNHFGPIRMPVFFAVSGLLARRIVDAPWPALVERRLWPLAYLFGLWTVINFAFRHGVEGAWLGDPLRTFAKAVLVPPSEIWFVLALGLYLTLTRLVAPQHRIAVLGAAVGVTVITFGEQIPVASTAWRGILQYYSFFLLGCLFGPELARRAGAVPVAAVLGLGLVFLALFELRYEIHGPALGVLRLALCGMGLVVGCRLAQAAVEVGGVGPGLAALGRSTLPVYLGHPILLSLAVMALPDGLSERTGLLLLLPLVAGAVVASLALHRLLVGAGWTWPYAPPPALAPAAVLKAWRPSRPRSSTPGGPPRPRS